MLLLLLEFVVVLRIVNNIGFVGNFTFFLVDSSTLLCLFSQVIINNEISSSTCGHHGAIGDSGTVLYCGHCLYAGAFHIVILVAYVVKRLATLKNIIIITKLFYILKLIRPNKMCINSITCFIIHE